jgi:hypothetical protein
MIWEFRETALAIEENEKESVPAGPNPPDWPVNYARQDSNLRPTV